MLESGTYTPQEDVAAIDINIPHSLGVVPDFIVVMADEFTATSDLTKNYIGTAFFIKKSINRDATPQEGISFDLTNNPNNTSYTPRYWSYTMSAFCTDTIFKIPRYNSGWMLKAGITYHYVIGKFKEVTSNA